MLHNSIKSEYVLHILLFIRTEIKINLHLNPLEVRLIFEEIILWKSFQMNSFHLGVILRDRKFL